MTLYEYKVVPAPRKGRKGRGIKGAEARFAFAIQSLMNEYSSDGWEFLRAETLASEERHGLASAQKVYRDLLVFRRLRAEAEAPVNEPVLDTSQDDSPDPEPSDQPDDEPETVDAAPHEDIEEDTHTAFATTRQG